MNKVNANNRLLQSTSLPSSLATYTGKRVVVVGGVGIVVVAVVKVMRAEVFNVIFKADVFF